MNKYEKLMRKRRPAKSADELKREDARTRGIYKSALDPLKVTGEATSYLPVRKAKDRDNTKDRPITIIGNTDIRETLDSFWQAMDARLLPGVSDVVMLPNTHVTSSVPTGCVMSSPAHIYLAPMCRDMGCSMSLLQMDIPAAAIEDKQVRQRLMDAICNRIPTGGGQNQRSVPLAPKVTMEIFTQAVTQGGTRQVCDMLGIPPHWALRCEQAIHTGHDGRVDTLQARLGHLIKTGIIKFPSDNMTHLGTLGGASHFGECNVVHINDDEQARDIARQFGLRDKHVAFFTHCGSRGFGYALADGQLDLLNPDIKNKRYESPSRRVFAIQGSAKANDLLNDMALAANFATVNHLLINKLVLDAFNEIFPGVQGELVYHLSHNTVNKERVPHSNQLEWVHRNGASRAFPAGHAALSGTPFEKTGHPIFIAGNPAAGSVVMAAAPEASLANYSISHGAGRVMGYTEAHNELNRYELDQQLDEQGIVSNCHFYPLDEAPATYKHFDAVVRSIKQAELARQVAKLQARFVIKDRVRGLGW